MYTKLLLFISIIIMIFSLIILIHNKYNINTYDTFADPKNPRDIIANDGNMNFNFLKSENSQYVLNTYYINDDKKINGKRVNFHPYQEQVANIPPPVRTYSKYLQNTAYPFIYGKPEFHRQRSSGQWNKYDTLARHYYNKYGVRR